MSVTSNFGGAGAGRPRPLAYFSHVSDFSLMKPQSGSAPGEAGGELPSRLRRAHPSPQPASPPRASPTSSRSELQHTPPSSIKHVEDEHCQLLARSETTKAFFTVLFLQSIKEKNHPTNSLFKLYLKIISVCLLHASFSMDYTVSLFHISRAGKF